MEHTIKQGWLFCSFSRIKASVKRWVVLKEKAIFFYIDSEMTKCLVKYDITTNFYIKYREKDLNHKYRFCLQGPRVCMYFQAENKIIAYEWISFLRIQANEILLNTFKLPVMTGAISIKEISQIDENFFINFGKYTALADQNELIQSHISMVLKCEDHPLGFRMNEFLRYWISTYGSGASETPNGPISRKSSYFLDTKEILNQHDDHYGMECEMEDVKDHKFYRGIKLINVFKDYVFKVLVEYYKKLLLEEKVTEEVFSKLVEDVLFGLLYDHIMPLYHEKYREDDLNCYNNILKFATITPAHLGVKEKFWLLEPGIKTPSPVRRKSFLRRLGNSAPICLGLQQEDADRIEYQFDPLTPYHHPISLMKLLLQEKAPYRKISLLVEINRAIIESVNAFHQSQDIIIGSDDLIPLLTYVIIKSHAPRLCSESKFMEDFMDVEDEFSNRGYCIANFMMCLAVLPSYDKSQLESLADDQVQSVIEKLPPQHLHTCAHTHFSGGNYRFSLLESLKSISFDHDSAE